MGNGSAITARQAWSVGATGVAGALVTMLLVTGLVAWLSEDFALRIHATIFAAAAATGTFVLLRKISAGAYRVNRAGEYNDEIVRAGVIATVFWGIVGFAVGDHIAWALAFPQLNFGLPFTVFGRVRPLHTSAVIFAFGGNALICTSFYVVQRTCRARLASAVAPWFVFWGYNLFIVIAATGYLLGVTQSKEYAEPEWYADLWLTIVWVTYIGVFLATLAKRKEPHIFVANWFYLGFMITVAMLHIVNNLAVPVSLLSSKSYVIFAGVQDAMTQWWYAHNAVGFFLTAGFLAMMYYFIPKRAERPVWSYRLSIVHFWSLIFI